MIATFKTYGASAALFILFLPFPFACIMSLALPQVFHQHPAGFHGIDVLLFLNLRFCFIYFFATFFFGFISLLFFSVSYLICLTVVFANSTCRILFYLVQVAFGRSSHRLFNAISSVSIYFRLWHYFYYFSIAASFFSCWRFAIRTFLYVVKKLLLLFSWLHNNL